jgi:hypothetical protein
LQSAHFFLYGKEWKRNCGQWTCDEALPLLGITREQAFEIPQVVGGAFALDFKKSIAANFFSRYMESARNGSFRGPWTNTFEQKASLDPRVMGHRHDQTAASVIAHNLGMKLTSQPDVFSDGRGDTPSTILRIER